VLRPEFVRRKLQLIVDDLAVLEGFRDVEYDALVTDPIRLAAVERIIERIVLRAIDVNEHFIRALATGDEARTTRLTYRETFLRLAEYDVYGPEFAERIARSAGLRNVLVHDYNDLDRRILHAAIRGALEDYHAYVETVRRFLER
jgi:uncharacterized protein YutE (UPF0331/DUF86 family)